jgi:glycosyltransferase involved in cell wall biosynthesis
MPTEKIRVLQVIPSLRSGGAERMMIHLLLGLDGSRYLGAAASLAPPQGTDLESIAASARLPIWYLYKRSGFDITMFWRLDRLVRRFRPDVVHIHLNALLYAAPVAMARRIPVVIYTAHNFPDLLVPHSLRWFYRSCFHHGVVPVSITRSLSPALCAEFHLSGMPLIPNGIPVVLYRQPRVARTEWRARKGFAENDLLFVCVARLSPQKNHRLLLEAFAAGPAACRQSHLLLVGDGELRASLSLFVSDLRLERRVHFLGNREDIPDVLGACDAFVLSSAQEANPLCVMEAMAAGLPVVSTAVGGVPELLESCEHGLLTRPGDVEDLARAMSFFTSHPEERRAWGHRAAERASRLFDVSRMARAYDSLYCRSLETVASRVQ